MQSEIPQRRPVLKVPPFLLFRQLKTPSGTHFASPCEVTTGTNTETTALLLEAVGSIIASVSTKKLTNLHLNSKTRCVCLLEAVNRRQNR